jgi:hypothetical protein
MSSEQSGTSNPIRGYSKIYNLGHRALADFFDGLAIEVTEKVDGSQFSFAMIEGELHFRSRNKAIDASNPGMFEFGVRSIAERASGLQEGWIYRGEYLSKPKHNTMAYDRTPAGHVVLFGIDVGDQHYLDYTVLQDEAERLGLEAVPHLGYVHKPSMEWLDQALETESFLGGQKVEGIVLKNYRMYDQDKKTLMAKFVSEAFKEKHGKEWKKANPSQGDVLEVLGESLRSEARWEKAVQRLRDDGVLTDTPADIGLLFKTVQQDIVEEEIDHIKETLFKWGWKKISKKTTLGLAEWYKRRLAEAQFDGEVA